MISLIGALRKLGKKITGKELDNKTLTAVVNEMAEEYNGASTDYVDNKIGERITSVYKFKGNVEDFSHLPSTKNKVGDTYNLLDSGMNYAWNGSKWDALGGSYVLTVTDIQNITPEQCENLKCGDTVIKLTGEQKHAYTVTFKKADEGMCLTYVDASCSETVSYDNVEGTWSYNSTDVTIFDDLAKKTDLPEVITPAGTEPTAQGLKINGIDYKVGGGDNLYKHFCSIYKNYDVYIFCIVTASATPFANANEILANIKKAISLAYYNSSSKVSQVLIPTAFGTNSVTVVNPDSPNTTTTIDSHYNSRYKDDVVVPFN